MTHHDYTYIDTTCPECESTTILRDNHREETYCTICGLVIQDNTSTPITQVTYPNNNGSFMGGKKKDIKLPNSYR